MFIPIDTLYFILTLIAGIAYGYYCYRNGLKTGAENAFFYLEEVGFINVNNETGEITRLSDKQYKQGY